MAAMTYLFRHPKTGVYWFNRGVPADLRATVGKSKIRKTLGTKEVAEAKRRAHTMALEVDRLFASARGGVKLELPEARALADAWRIERLDDLDDVLLEAPPATDADSDVHALVLHDDIEALAEGMQTRRWTPEVVEAVNRILAKRGLAADKRSAAFQRLALEVSKAALEVRRVYLKRLEGSWTDAAGGPRPVVVSPALSPLVQPPARVRRDDPDNPLLSQALALWIVERKPPAKTIHEWQRSIRRFGEVVGGDLPVKAVTKGHVREFKAALFKMPRVLSGDLRGLPVPAVLAAVGDDPTVARGSPSAVRKALAALQSILGWCVKQGFIEANPVSGLLPADPEADREKRLPYDDADLKAIFERSDRFAGKKAARDADFWLPLLALYTGCRQEELGQALAEDVKREGGIDFLDINTLHEGKSLKTKGSRRKVPLHPELIRLGFLKYVASLRRKGERQLFPELRADGLGKRTKEFSRRWARYTDGLGIDDPRKVFHSFRHAFKEACRRARIPEDVHDALTGHANGSVGRRYGSGQYPIEVLAEEVAKIAYPVKLRHLYA